MDPPPPIAGRPGQFGEMEDGLNGPTLTRMAARHARQEAARLIPTVVQAKVATCILDHLSCCIGAQSMTWFPALRRYLGSTPVAGEAMQWGLPAKISAAEAAFGNGVLSHGLIREDMRLGGGSHIGVVVLPSLLALAAREAVSGAALMAGIVAGYEMTACIGSALRSGLQTQHFRAIGVAGAFGAAAGLAVALGLDEDAVVSALGFAANFAGGLNEWSWSGGQDIYVHAGFAARNAVLAVDLARSGLVASDSILEGRDGMFAAFDADAQAASMFAESLDGEHRILSVKHKPIPGCNFIQTPVAAALALYHEMKIDPEAITSIVIRTFEAARANPGCDSTGPFNNVQQTKMSLQYGVAAALSFGRVDEDVYTRIDDPGLYRLVGLCTIETVAGFAARYPAQQPAEIVGALRDGRTLRRTLADVPWFTAEAVAERFRTEACRLAPVDVVDRTARAVQGLGDASSCDALFEAVCDLNAMTIAQTQPDPAAG